MSGGDEDSVSEEEREWQGGQKGPLGRVKRKGLPGNLLPEQPPDWSEEGSHTVTWKEHFGGDWRQDIGPR